MMKKKLSTILFLSLLLLCLDSFAQTGFQYKRKINGINAEWHQIIIPTDIYPISYPGFSDLRIQSYTNKGDTLNIPYILEKVQRKQIEKEVEFKIINESYRNDWYYFTLVCPQNVLVNNLTLDFDDKNFDWHVNLDAAEKLGEWMTILDDVRILAFHQEQESYVFSKLKFRDAHYPYYRVSIRGSKRPNLRSVKLSYQEDIPGASSIYPVTQFTVQQLPQQKISLIEFNLDNSYPIESILLFSKSNEEFFRKLEVEIATDSIWSDAKWTYNYIPVTSTFISSDDFEPIYLNDRSAKRIRVKVFNQDDEPINFESVQVFGPQYRLILKVKNQEAFHYLLYGNKQLNAPVYDLVNFRSSIPNNLDKLTLSAVEKGNITSLDNKKAVAVQPKIWLWGILISIVVLLFYFSIKLIKQDYKQ